MVFVIGIELLRLTFKMLKSRLMFKVPLSGIFLNLYGIFICIWNLGGKVTGPTTHLELGFSNNLPRGRRLHLISMMIKQSK